MRKWLIRIAGVFVLAFGAVLWIYGLIERAALAARAGQKRDDALRAAEAKQRTDVDRIRSEPAENLQDELTRPLGGGR